MTEDPQQREHQSEHHGSTNGTESTPLLSPSALYTAKQEDNTTKPRETDGPIQRLVAPVRTSELSGVVLMLLGALVLSVNAFLVHVAGARLAIPPTTTLFVRSFVHTVTSASYLVFLTPFRQTVGALTRPQYLLLLLRGAAGGVAVTCVYVGLKFISTGDATAIFFISPAFTLIMCHYAVGERVTGVDMAAVAVSLTGAALMARPDSADAELEHAISATARITGSLLTVIGATLASVVYTTIRYLGMSIHFMTSVFSLGFFGTIITVCMGGFVTPTQLLSYGTGGATLVIASAGLSLLMQVFLNLGLQRCRAGPGTLLTNIEVPFTYMLGLVFLHEQPSEIRIMGACLIVSASVLIGVRQLANR